MGSGGNGGPVKIFSRGFSPFSNVDWTVEIYSCNEHPRLWELRSGEDIENHQLDF